MQLATEKYLRDAGISEGVSKSDIGHVLQQALDLSNAIQRLKGAAADQSGNPLSTALHAAQQSCIGVIVQLTKANQAVHD